MFVRPVVALLLLAVLVGTRPPRAAAQDAPRVPLDELGAFRDTLDVRLGQPFRLRPFVRPGTERIYVDGVRLDTASYRVDARAGTLWIPGLPTDTDTLVAVYRTWPFREVYRRRVVTTPDSGAAVVVANDADASRDDPFGNAQLQRSGSITRGIIAGSGRDVSVESGLSMQLAGEVAPGVRVQAALTDENTPIQPEGTTQRLSEFDRVYIGLDADAGTARLGDIELAFGESAFARYGRKLQGAAVTGLVPGAGAFAGGTVTAAGAASRGLFRRQTIPALEGVQGPYRLEGAAGEQFIIVIAGSERVFLDGVPLERGASSDYVIDYQTGEITFTPRQLITGERRIVAEFQYTTSEYNRTIVATRGEAAFWPGADGAGRARLGATFIREADARRLSSELGFSPEDSLLIAEAGDGIAARSGAQPVVFDPEAPYVQYVREPRETATGVDTAFVPVERVPEPGTTVYRVSFTRVGPGEGRYARVGRSINGLLFEYRGPGAGDYEPIRVLPTPRQQRLVDVHGAATPFPGIEVFGEYARSILDANRLSSLDGGDDGGGAVSAGVLLQRVPVEVRGATVGHLSGHLRHRQVEATFEPFERVRPVEFERTWNLLSRTPGGFGEIVAGDERLDEALLRLDVGPGTFVVAEAGQLDLGGTFDGARAAGAVGLARPGLPELDYAISLVRSTDRQEAQTGSWLKQGGAVAWSRLGGRLTPIVAFEHEHLRQRVLGTDSLVAFPTTEAYVELRPGVTLEGEKVTAGGSVEVRTERDVGGGILRDAGRAYTVQANLDVRPAASFSADADIGYRMREVTDYFRLNERRADNASVAIRLNSRWTPWRRAVDAGLFYEAQTERTPTLQELYVRTGPELGEYVWEDANGDGLVQVDEFVPERTPAEGTYVRTFVPSDSLAPTVGVQARLTVGLDPSRTWRDAAERWKQRLGAVQTRTTIEVLEKSRDERVTRLYVLDPSRFRVPGATINGRLRLVQEVNLFRRTPAYGLDLRADALRSLTELTSGEEARRQTTWQGTGYYRFGERGAVRVRGEFGRNRATSDAYASRRYDIRSVTVTPEGTLNPSRALQLTVGASYSRKEDRLGDRMAHVAKLPVEARFSRFRQLQIATRGEIARVALDGEATGLARYELTDGRGPGTSYLWSVFAQYALNTYLSATLSYDGRAPSDAPALHTVRVQLSATF